MGPYPNGRGKRLKPVPVMVRIHPALPNNCPLPFWLGGNNYLGELSVYLRKPYYKWRISGESLDGSFDIEGYDRVALWLNFIGGCIVGGSVVWLVTSFF
jgi:hypothetical protein